MANFTHITSSVLQKEIPDFPSGMTNCGVGSCRRDVVWFVKPMTFTQRRKAKIPPSNIIEQEVEVPVITVLQNLSSSQPVLESLRELIEKAKQVIESLSKEDLDTHLFE